MARHTIIIGKAKVFMELSGLRNPRLTGAMASETLRSSGGAMGNLGRTTCRAPRCWRGCGGGGGAGFMACLACCHSASVVIGWVWERFGGWSMTDQTIGIAAGWMGNGFGCAVWRGNGTNWRFNNVSQLRSIQAGKFPSGSMTCAVGAEG